MKMNYKDLTTWWFPIVMGIFFSLVMVMIIALGINMGKERKAIKENVHSELNVTGVVRVLDYKIRRGGFESVEEVFIEGEDDTCVVFIRGHQDGNYTADLKC